MPQTFKPTDRIPDNTELLTMAPLAQKRDQRPLPKIQNVIPSQQLSGRAYPEEITLISNQEVNRALSRERISSDVRFPPIKGEKAFEPSNRIRRRLGSLRRNLSAVYMEDFSPPDQEKLKGEIIPSEVPSKTTELADRLAESVSMPRAETVPSRREAPLASPVTELPKPDEIHALREELAKKEENLPPRASKEELEDMVGTYQKKIRQLNQRMKSLRQQTQQVEEHLANLRKGVGVLQEEKVRHEPIYQGLQGRVAKLKKALSQSQQTTFNLKEKLLEREQEERRYQQLTTSEREAVQKVYNEKKAAEALVGNLRSALGNAKEELKQAKERIVTAEELQEKEEKIQKLSSKLRDKEDKLQSMGSLSSELEEKIVQEKRLRKELVNFKDEMAKLQEGRLSLTQRVQTEEAELTKLRAKMEDLLQKNRGNEEKLKHQKVRLGSLQEEKRKLTSFANELAAKLTEFQNMKHLKKVVEAESEGQEVPEQLVVKVVPAQRLGVVKKPLTELKNAINGVVRDEKGRFVQNAVVIIKDLENHPLRALRTNELGQFMVTTPLRNETYRIEVEKTGLKFDILEVKPKGEVLAPLSIRAK